MNASGRRLERAVRLGNQIAMVRKLLIDLETDLRQEVAEAKEAVEAEEAEEQRLRAQATTARAGVTRG